MEYYRMIYGAQVSEDFEKPEKVKLVSKTIFQLKKIFCYSTWLFCLKKKSCRETSFENFETKTRRSFEKKN